MTTVKSLDMELGESKHWYDGLLTGVTGGAVLACIMALLKAAEKVVPFLIKKRVEFDVINGITDQSPIYVEMEKAVSNEGAHRVLMLAGHNGGHVPSVLTPFFVSAIHAAANTVKHRQRASLYKDIRVDSHYIKMLEVMIRDGSYRFTTATETPCILKEFYASEGVKDALLCHLGVWNKSLIYVSFSTFGELFTDNQITSLKLRAVAIREKLRQSK